MSKEHERVGTFCEKCRQVLCKCSSKEQTAVDWLREQFHKVPFSQFGNLFQEAKEMEKKQIISFAYKQIENCHNEMGEIMYSKVPEELYNDTYGK